MMPKPCPLTATDFFQAGLREVEQNHPYDVGHILTALDDLAYQSEISTRNRFVLGAEGPRLDWCPDSILGIDWEQRVKGVYRIIYRTLVDGRGHCAEVVLLCLGWKPREAERALGGRRMKKVNYQAMVREARESIRKGLIRDIENYDGSRKALVHIFEGIESARLARMDVKVFLDRLSRALPKAEAKKRQRRLAS